MVASSCRWKLLPRVLVDVSDRDLSTTVLGHRISFPVCIASTAMHRMAHPDGEVATAQGKDYFQKLYGVNLNDEF